jgi:A/G-specific adenine glycosylase
VVEAFREAVLAEYRERGRAFPWRETRDPWAILVSELMLQQTQVSRVVPKYLEWLRRWPDPASLASASVAETLAAWSGLGYNRRALAIRAAAGIVAREYGGTVPEDLAALRSLPGVGTYTAGAIRAFAFGLPEVFLETNIRSALLHWFFPERDAVRDGELLPVAALVLDASDPRAWYYALMDYGAALKRVAPNPSRRSAHHAPQTRFEGSLRQARGAIVRLLASSSGVEAARIPGLCGMERDRVEKALASLVAEGTVEYAGSLARIREG